MIAFVAYLLFIPLTIFSAMHMVAAILMSFAGIVVAFCELSMLVERHSLPMTSQRQPGIIIIQEMMQIVRVLGATLVPILLASFGGASFVVTTQMQSLATDCNVAELPLLAQSNYLGFHCNDGFIALSMQLGVPAFEDTQTGTSAEGGGHVHHHKARLLQEAGAWAPVTVGESEGNRYGYVAPLFESMAAYTAAEPPVAWAVKAGSPVRRSICDDDGSVSTCGFFAGTLKETWRTFPAPPWFGQAWGYNITHFSSTAMIRAVEEIRKRHPDRDLGSGPPTFVVAESIRQYFGLAYPCLWVLGTLLATGFVDRLTALFDHATPEEEDGVTYGKVVADPSSPLVRLSADRSLFGEVASLWEDPLGDSGKA